MIKQDVFHLSMVQQDIYFDQLHHGDSPLYNIGGYINLPCIDVERLKAAHQKLIHEYDAFGIRICVDDSAVMQYICDKRTSSLPIVDFSEQSDPEEEAKQWLKKCFQTSIPMESGELFKATLLKLNESSWFYVGLAHHICMDGWGFANWAERLGVYYNSLECTDELSRAWHEVVEREVQYRSSTRYEKDKQYWAAQLEKLPEPCLSPFYHQQFPENSTIPSSRTILPISVHKHQQMQKRANELDVPLAQLYQALIALYFARAYCLPSLVLGSPVHNRTDKRDKSTLGAFISVIPIVLDIDIDSTLSQFCAQINAKMRKNFKHQRYPVGDMRRDLLQGAQLRELYEIGYNYLKLNSNLDIDGQDANLVYLSHNYEQTPIMFTVWEYGEGLGVELQIDHNLAFFNAQDIEAMLPRIELLIAQVLDGKLDKLSEYSVIPQIEQEKILKLGEGESLPYDKNALVHQLFSRQACLTPYAVAVEYEGTKLTYNELDIASNRLANYLIEQGAKPQQRVGIHCPRTTDVIIALMATLKCGLTFIALDPNYPASRIEYIVENSGIKWLLSHSTIKRTLLHVECINVDDIKDISNYNSVAPDIAICDESLAYCIYTSGSTGNPKGVMIRHQNLLALIHWARKQYSDRQLRRTLASTSLNFDLSMFELFVPLCFGHTVVLVENALSLLSRDYDISLVNTVPSAAKALLHDGAIPASVNTINLAGEPLSAQLVNALLKTSCSQVYNLYGPSEDTTYSTVTRFMEPLNTVPDIGVPIANTQAFILSARQELIPVGQIGELYLAGAGVAAGYLNRSDLTCEKFIKLPFAEGVAYRTGDLVRFGHDGKLNFIGRMDDQVKLRGFRIELGEIEHVLCSLDGVSEAVTLVVDEILVAYCVGHSINSELLKQEVQKQLPFYMVPSSIVELDYLPLTPNGKIDKKALLTLKLQRNSCIEKPASPIEEQLAKLVAETLSLDYESISMSSSFFELGGHSLNAINLLAKLKKETGKQLSMRDIFDASPLRNLAQRINLVPVFRSLVELGAITHPDDIPLSAAQKRLWLAHSAQGHSRNYHMPFALHFEKTLNLEALQSAIETILERHQILRSCYIEQPNKIVIKALPSDSFAINRVELPGASYQDNQVNTLIETLCNEDFDLSAQLPIRATWIDLEGFKGILVVIVHHIAFDGWSAGVFLNELAQLYYAKVAGVQLRLPDVGLQYVDYALWVDALKELADYQTDAIYWRTQLQGAPRRHSLPIRTSRAEVEPAKCISRELGCEQVKALSEIAKQYKLTLFSLLHAALALVVSRNSFTNDIVIGTASSNRNSIQLQQLIGFCVNTLALRVNLEHYSLSDYFSHVRDVHLQAFEHQTMPFDEILDACDIEVTSGYNPLFQIFLTLNDVTLERQFVERLHAQRLNVTQQQSKFELEIDAQLDGDKLTVNWLYDVSVFNSQTINSLCSQLDFVLHQLIENVPQKLSDIKTLSKPQHNELLQLQKGSIVTLTDNALVHDVIERRAAQTPQKIALRSGQTECSYRQLNQQVLELAHYLQENYRVLPGEQVGIYTENSIDLITVALAVLKSGAVFIRLDPRQPSEYIEAIIETAALKCVVSANDQLDTLNRFSCSVINLYRNRPATGDYLQHTLETSRSKLGISMSSPAYVEYGFGSSKQLIGKLFDHAALTTHQHVAREKFAIGCADVAWISNSLGSFIPESLSVLCQGSTVIVGDDLDLQQPQHGTGFADVSVMFLSATAWSRYIDQIQVFEHGDLTRVVAIGESVSNRTLQHHLKFFNEQVKLFNTHQYLGTTSSALCRELCQLNIDENDSLLGDVTINAQAFVLDRDLLLSPLGSIGELYIGGACLAKTYLNQPALSQTSFVENPYYNPDVQESYARLHRTGELVRYDTKGNLIRVGHVDNLTKVKGTIVDVALVERFLEQQPNLDSAVVFVGDDAQLMGYVKADFNLEESDYVKWLGDLKWQLKSHLPAYMVPTELYLVSSWPKLSCGKIDKQALLNQESTKLFEAYIAPKNQVEKVLTELWSQPLGIPAHLISTTANVFELGAHSMSALKVSTGIAEQLTLACKVRNVFEYPTIVSLAQHLKTQQVSTESALLPLVRTERSSNSYPLSFAQQRIWFLSQLEASSSVFNMAAALDIKGKFNISKAATALEQIVSRHEILRSQFIVDHDEPVVRLNTDRRCGITLHDLSGFEVEKQRQALAALSLSHRQHQFDLAKEPLLQVDYAKLTKSNDSEHGVLLFNIHHLIADGWSIGILIREFIMLYEAEYYDRPAQLVDLPIQYIDYVRWQKQSLNSEYLSQATRYWRELLAGAPSSHSLQLDYARGKRESASGLSRQMLPKSLTSAIKEQLKQTQSTLFMYFQTAFALLVGRVSHETDVVMGGPIAGRSKSECASLIGLFLNNQVYRTQFDDNPSWFELLKRSKSQHIASLDFNDMPFELLVESLNPERRLNQSPIFQLFINHNNTEQTELSIPDCDVSMEQSAEFANKYDLTLYIEDAVDGQLKLIWSYDGALFKESTIDFYQQELAHLLSMLCAEPECPVLSHQWHGSPSWGQIISKDNNDELQIYRLIESQAKKQPSQKALSFADQSLTYKQLVAKVDCLAEYFLKRGMHQSDIVAVYNSRDVNRILIILAILKLGAAYVPLSEELPISRIQTMLDISEARFLISDIYDDGKVQLHLPKGCEKINVCEANSQKEISLCRGTATVSVDADSIAHVIFTSGSTGKPKGVAGTFGATANRIHWMISQFSFEHGESSAHITSMSFIRGVWELLVPLCGGGHLLLCDRETVKDTAKLWNWLSFNQINRIVTAPSLMKALTEQSSLHSTPLALKHWFVSGEPLLQVNANEVLNKFPDTRLYNLYGSTEVMSDVTWHEVVPGQDNIWVSIGKAINNCTVMTLGMNGLPVPANVIGEIAVAGASLAIGYLGQQNTNAAFTSSPIGVIYKTGDLGVYNSKGELLCLGRRDDQIKIRGYRVELGEITACITKHAQVKNCVIRPVGELPDIRLIAYLVRQTFDNVNDEILLSSVKNTVSSELPSYMQPTFYVLLDELPLRPNGKVDRQALPQPDLSSQSGFTAAQTEMEKNLVQQWAKLLGLETEQVGVTTSFFELGGHSLLVTKLLHQLQTQLGFVVSYQTFFTHNTIRLLTEYIEKEQKMKLVLEKINYKNNKLVI
jgi:amino acid adenylation domain-containing protein